MKKICILLSLIFVLMCSGCGIKMEPILEGTYYSYDEENNETFSKAKFIIKETNKEEYEQANGKNVFIDGSTYFKEDKIYLSIEFYLYAIATEQYELVTLIDLKYSTGTGHCYYGKANLMIGDTIYEDDHITMAFYYFEDKNRVHAGVFYETNYEYSSNFRLE